MENIDYPKFKPEKITKPIQLLAVWFIGLIFIDGLFIYTATIIKNIVLEFFLVLASILNVPLFLYLLFKLQTKFRAELQEDSYYSKYLNKTTKNLDNKDLERRVKFRNEMEEQILSIDKKLDSLDDKIKAPNMEKDINDIKESYEKLINMISHNLKSSLQGIDSGAYLLEKSLGNPNVSKERMFEIIERIKTNTQINNITLDNLLYQNQEKITISEKITLKELLIPIINILKPFSSNKNISINLDILKDLQITCDRKALRIAIYNVLENALKYSPDSSNIDIHAQLLDEFVCIRIMNESKPIHEKELNDLFKLGYRAKNAINQTGSGIGLFNTNQILKQHNGSIQFSNEGYKFVTEIKIPIKR